MTCKLCLMFWLIGHIWSLTLLRWWPFEWGSGAVYWVYNHAMLKSLELNDKGDCGEWSARVMS